jgi:hypothetical protein
MRDRDRDRKAAVASRAGGDRAVVDLGDGRDDGETEALPAGAIGEALERLEQAAGIRWADDRAARSGAASSPR